MCVVASHGDAGDVNRSVADGLHRQVFFAGVFAAGGEFRHRSARCCLGHLATSIGIDFCVEHQDVDVHTRSQNVIESTGADVIGPSVATHQPHAFAHQRLGNQI